MLRRCASVLLAAAAFAGGSEAIALTCQSNATGNWNAAGTWTACGGGIPGAADDVQIRLGHVVTITAGFGAVANSVTFTSSNGAARIDHAANTSTLTVGAGGVTMNASANNNTRAWNINTGSASVNGAVSMTSTSNNRPLHINITTGSLDINGNLTMNAANAVRAVIDMSGGAGNLFIGGSFTLSTTGTLTPGTSSTVTYDSATTPATVATGGSVAYHHLVIAKGAGNTANAAATGNLTVGGNLTITSGTFNIPGITASIAGATNVSGTLGFATSTAGTKTFTGSVTVNPGAAWTNAINAPITIGADLANNGTFTSGTGTYTFNGTAAQGITGTNGGTTTFANLTLNNANGLSLTGTHDVTVTTLLSLTAGPITTNANILHISNGSNIASAGGANFVAGNLRKAVGPGGCTTCNFEIGTVAGGPYTPVTSMAFTGITAGGTLTATTSATEHPNIGSSGLDDAQSVNRYWTFVNNGIAFASFNATFNWVAGDVDGGADTAVFEMQRYSPPAPAAGTWNATTPAAQNATNIQVTGVTGFGDFAVGQPLSVAIGIGRFNAYDTTTAAGAVSGYITTKVAGAAFAMDVIAIVNNRKSINTGFTGTVQVELLNASDNSGAADTSTGCRASWTTVIQSFSTTFVGGDNGRKTVNVTEANAWREVRVRMTGGGLTGCSTDAFAIRPASLTVSASDATWATSGTTRVLNNTGATGGNVHKAGQPFTITVAPSPVSATNYDGTLTVASIACSLPVSCVTGTFDAGTFSGTGTRVSSTATYTEAGAFDVTFVDQTFALVDAIDGTPADCSASGRYVCQSPAPAAIGRFVPDRFEFAAPNVPVLLTFGAPMCANPRSFTYVGQPFWFATPPSATLNAVNSAGAVTQNYPLSTAASRPVVGETYADATAPAAAPLDTASVGSPAAISGSGTGAYSPSASGQLSYARSTTTPVGPFTAAISLTVSASDGTEAAVSGNGTIVTPAPLVFNGGGGGIAFDAGAEFRYGRLRLNNANGPQFTPLVVPLETQYWSGSSFVTNSADHCTAIGAANIQLDDYKSNLNACETSLTVGALASGRAAVFLSAPGKGNEGNVRLTARLESSVAGPTTCIAGASTPVSGADLMHLQGNWSVPTFTQNPAGRATFGVYQGSQEIIHFRETF